MLARMIDESPPKSGRSTTAGIDSPNRGFVLALLCVVAVFNMVDRQIITIVLEPIKEEFGASDTEMGLLTGLIFAVFYAAAAIPLARWADRGERRIVMAACLGFWSLMTTLGGFAQSFMVLAMTRIGVAVGEAGASPTSQSMLSDLYPLRSRATVMATLSSFQSIGIGLGVLLGGWLSDSVGWRAAFFVVGVPGILLALVIFFALREPARGAVEGLADEPSDAGFVEVFGQLARITTYRCLVAIGAFVALCGYGALMWGPTFFRRVHGLSGTETGIVFGLATMTALVLGNMAAGLVADRAGDRDLRWYMRVAAIGPALGFPCGLVFVFAEETTLAVAGYLFFQLFITFHIPPVYAVAQTLAPLRARATAMVVIGLFQTSVGIGLAPLLIGGVNDALEPRMGVEAIRYSLGLVMVGALIASLIAFRATFSIQRDYESSRRQDAVE
jgi:MFS family permease